MIERRQVTVVQMDAAPWPVYWSAIWVGVLAALALGLIFGLMGVMAGAHVLGARVVRWSEFGLGTLIFSVFGAFFSFVLGGWVAARIADLRRAEAAALHGAIVWLLSIPFLVLLVALGAGGFLGWWAGVAGSPVWIQTQTAMADPDAAAAARNSALGAVTGLLLGLVGGVIGGWLGSGQMVGGSYRRR